MSQDQSSPDPSSEASNDNQPSGAIEVAWPVAETVPAESADSYEIVAGSVRAGAVIVCDHAGNAFPEGYGTLGLPAAELERHIAYDIGAAAVVRELARRTRAPAVLSRFSRLLIDLNRGLDDPTLVMRLSDGAIIPGNRHVDAAERQRRIEHFYLPYHRAVTSVVDACVGAGRPPVLIAMHSFTNVWQGVPRPWHIGILWDKADARVARPIIEALRADGELVVGDNEPYRGHLDGDTMWQHGLSRGLPHVLFELRQDLIRDQAGQMAWAGRIADVLGKLPEEFRPG